MLPDLQDKKKVDRLPIIVSFDGNEQLLGAPKVDSGPGKGKRIAEAVYNLLVEWRMLHRVQGFSFDTTAANTGRLTGASRALEQLFERNVLYLPCRHHIYELVLREVFDTKFGKTSAPGVLIFDRFKDRWETIKTKAYTAGVENDEVAKWIPVAKQIEMRDFCKAQLNENQPRHDYREFLQLIILFLGEDLGEYLFRLPGPISHARWMAKGIYSLKMFLYRKHFKMTARELNALRDVCIFIVLRYAKAWFRSDRAEEAPNQDLNFMKSIAEYAAIDKELSQNVLSKFVGRDGHTWYLSDEAIALAFFDSNVPTKTKIKMVIALRADSEESKESEEEDGSSVAVYDTTSDEDDEEDDDEEPALSAGTAIITHTGVKKLTLKLKDVDDDFMKKDLSGFVTSNTINFFIRFGLSQDFLNHSPADWDDLDDYKEALKIVKKLRVVNDTAERGVKMVQDYNEGLCRNEEEFQDLLLVIANYRKQFPTSDKNKLI